MAGDLFTLEDTSAAEVPDVRDIKVRVEQFLNRWHWRGDRAVVRLELEELIAEAKR